MKKMLTIWGINYFFQLNFLEKNIKDFVDLFIQFFIYEWALKAQWYIQLPSITYRRPSRYQWVLTQIIDFFKLNEFVYIWQLKKKSLATVANGIQVLQTCGSKRVTAFSAESLWNHYCQFFNFVVWWFNPPFSFWSNRCMNVDWKNATKIHLASQLLP